MIQPLGVVALDGPSAECEWFGVLASPQVIRIAGRVNNAPHFWNISSGGDASAGLITRLPGEPPDSGLLGLPGRIADCNLGTRRRQQPAG